MIPAIDRPRPRAARRGDPGRAVPAELPEPTDVDIDAAGRAARPALS